MGVARNIDSEMLGTVKYPYKKGAIYIAWPKRDPVGPGLAVGVCSASKRSPNGRFDTRHPLSPGTLVMFIKRAKHGMLRVLYGNTILQIHENFVWGTPEEFKKTWKKTIKKMKRKDQ